MVISGFYERLKEGPMFLLLGQIYLGVETARDPLLPRTQDRHPHQHHSPIWRPPHTLRGLVPELALRRPTRRPITRHLPVTQE